MYPLVRFAKELVLNRWRPPLGITETHVSHHVCWPWDLDIWMELNNGRSLTLYDLGRIPLAGRIGLIAVLRRNRWGLTMAGASVRYRHRVRVFDHVRMQSRLAGWDARFFYVEQSMWRRDGACANHILYRAAVTGRDGIVAPFDVLTEMGHDGVAPALPDWITAWIDAETQRPWPPEQE